MDSLALILSAISTLEPRAVTVELWGAKRKCPKRPSQDIFQNHVVWSQPSRVVGRHMWSGPLSMLFQRISNHVGCSHMIEYEESTAVRFQSAVVFYKFCVRPISKRWFLKTIQPEHETWSIWCHVGIHVDFFYSLAPLVPQAYCEANLDRLRLFHQWECLKCNGHGLLVLYVKWSLLSLCNLMVSCVAPQTKNHRLYTQTHTRIEERGTRM